MIRLIKLVTLAVSFGALGVSSASAATITSRSPIGPISNTAAVAGNTGANFAGPKLAINAAVDVLCNDVTYDPGVPTTNSITVTPTFSNCAARVNGTAVAAATIDHNCGWTFTFASGTFTASALTDNVRVDVPCSTTITAPTLGCTFHVTPVTNVGGITAQNINSAGAADTSASPWGSRIDAAVSGLHYTTTVTGGGTCGPNVAATGNGSLTGSAYAKNLWGML